MAKEKPPPKRPERVGIKRGKYKPRDRPNWNKHIKEKEREERKAKAKAEKLEKAAAAAAAAAAATPKPKPPKRQRPPRVKPAPRSALVSVPAEVLSLVAQYIVPPAVSLADGLVGPHETRYPPLTQNVTSSLKTRNERWGTVPQFILDLINLSKCCRQTHEMCQRILSEYGGSRPAPALEDFRDKDNDAASTGDSDSVPTRPASLHQAREYETTRMAWAKHTKAVAERRIDKRYLYLRLSHCGITGDNLFAQAAASGDTLEHLVLHSCGGDHGTFPEASHRRYDSASPINRSAPFQAGHPSKHIALPQLKSAQIGPHVCEECMRACIRLLTERKFFSKAESGTATLPKWVASSSPASLYEWRETRYNHAAAPQLEAIQLYLPLKSRPDRYQQSSPYSDPIGTLGADIRRSLKALSLILAPNERRWGGFGVSGFSSNVHQKTREDVEKDLAARARIYLTSSGSSTVRKRAKEAEALAVAKDKWAILAPQVLAKPTRPSATLADTAARAAAASLVASIKPHPRVGNKGKGRASGPKGVDRGPAPAPSAVSDSASTPTPVTGRPLHSEGSAVGPARKRPHAETPSDDSDADENAMDVRLRSSGAKRRYAQVRVKAEDGIEDDRQILTAYDRQNIANRVRLHDQFPALLHDIASQLPQLRALQVVRLGTARVDVIEDFIGLKDYEKFCVNPLRRLEHLEHLDLGLAVVGQRELRDFPLGVSIPETPPNATLTIARNLAVRRKLLEADIKRATLQGDAWRKLVLNRFVLGIGGTPRDLRGRTSGSEGTDEDSTDEEDEFDVSPQPDNLAAAEASSAPRGTHRRGWPPNLRSGFVYSADLEQRGIHRGILTSWRKETNDDQKEVLVITKAKVML